MQTDHDTQNRRCPPEAFAQHGQDPRITRAKTFVDTSIYGGNNVLGDIYHFNEASSEPRQPQRLLDSLHFSEMYLRNNQILVSHRDTFEWIFKDQAEYCSTSEFHPSAVSGHDNFSQWLTNCENQFWISGKPGSGKSTLMKFLANHPMTQNLSRVSTISSDSCILQSYFWLHGVALQRTLKGCICNLIHQMFSRDKELALRWIGQASHADFKKSVGDWSLSELRSCLLQVLEGTPNKKIIFLDALDEFDKDSDIRDLFVFIHDLTTLNGVKLCLSSRQEPRFEQALSRLPRIRLQDLTFVDMKTAAKERIAAELLETGNPTLTQSNVDDLAHEVALKAEGVFLWTELATRNLVTGMNNFDDLSMLRTRLSRLPKGMEELYKHMWSQLCLDNDIYKGDTDLYFSLCNLYNKGWYFDRSLVQFTLAADRCLWQRITSLNRVPDEDFIRMIGDACDIMERKIHARTGGLLEVIHHSGNYSVKTAIHVNTVCNDLVQAEIEMRRCRCPEQADFQLRNCSEDAQCQKKAHHAMAKNVVYIHRSAAEFVLSADLNRSSTAIDLQSAEAQERHVLASLATFGLGLLAKEYIVEGVIVSLSNTLETSTEQRLNVFLPAIAAFGEKSLMAFRRHECNYGWDHEIFFHHTMEKNQIGGSRCLGRVQHYFDFNGLVAACACSSAIATQLEPILPRISPYYLGYLLICATRALVLLTCPDWELPAEVYLRRAKSVLWLITAGADLRSPQLCVIEGRSCCKVLPRRPVVECWLFVLRLLKEYSPRHSLPSSFISICKDIVSLLSANEDLDSEEILWTVGTSYGSWPHADISAAGGECFTFVVKTSIRELGIYVSQSLDRPITGKMFDRTDTPPIHIQTVTWYTSRETDWERYKDGNVTLATDQMNDQDLITILSTTIAHVMQHSPDQQNHLLILKTKIRDYYWSQSKNELICEHKGFRDLLPIYAPLAMTTRSFKWRETVFVAPDMFRPVKEDEWYEYGILREWHNQRRLGVAKATRGARRYEKMNHLTPSYEVASECVDLSESGVEWDSNSSEPDLHCDLQDESSDVDEGDHPSIDHQDHEEEHEVRDYRTQASVREDSYAYTDPHVVQGEIANVAVDPCANERPSGASTNLHNYTPAFPQLQYQQGTSNARPGLKRKRTDPADRTMEGNC